MTFIFQLGEEGCALLSLEVQAGHQSSAAFPNPLQGRLSCLSVLCGPSSPWQSWEFFSWAAQGSSSGACGSFGAAQILCLQPLPCFCALTPSPELCRVFPQAQSSGRSLSGRQERMQHGGIRILGFACRNARSGYVLRGFSVRAALLHFNLSPNHPSIQCWLFAWILIFLDRKRIQSSALENQQYVCYDFPYCDF